MFRVKAATFVATLVLLAAAYAEPSPVLAAGERADVVALEGLVKSAATAAERKLAAGRLLDLRQRDKAALAMLQPLAKGAADKDIRAAAWLSLANVAMQRDRYADAARAMAAAKALRSTPFSTDEQQNLDMAKALAGERPMTVGRLAAGRVPVTRDMAGLPRVPMTVGGVAIDAVFDTGAGFSTVTESAATRLGIRMLDGAVAVASSSKETLPTKLGVAGRLEFGDAVLYNVVFIVLPDSTLTFGGGVYKIEAIVGLPVMEALSRIEFARADGKEFIGYGRGPGRPALGNLILADGQPLVLCEADGKPLRLFLDSGATTTMLNSSAAKDYPALTAAAVKEAATLTGAGGSNTDENAMTLPLLRLTIAGGAFALEKVNLYSKYEATHHGVIGQDLLKQGKGWVMDFDSMSFAIEN